MTPEELEEIRQHYQTGVTAPTIQGLIAEIDHLHTETGCNQNGLDSCTRGLGWMINDKWFCSNHWSVIPATELATIRAENERLRDALERIAAGNPASLGKWLSDVEMADIARAALAEGGE